MSDAPAAAVFCGEMCNGCQEDCAACATMACGDCGGCEHGRELARRGRAAGAAFALLQIGSGVPLEFGFNPNQLRGPDGRFIKMGGRGSAGKGGLPKGSGLKNPRVDANGRPHVSEGGGAGAGGGNRAPKRPGVALDGREAEVAEKAFPGTTRYDFAPKDGGKPGWVSLSPATAPKWIDALAGNDDDVLLQAGYRSGDKRDKSMYGEVRLTRDADGNVNLHWGKPYVGATEKDESRVRLTKAEASALADQMRGNAERDRAEIEATTAPAVPDSPEVAARKKEGQKLLADVNQLKREIGDEFEMDDEELQAAFEAIDSDAPNSPQVQQELRKVLEQYGRRSAPAPAAAPAAADSPGRVIAKRKYSDGDRVPLADGTEGTVVGGHHLVAGRPGQYVTVRPDGGGKTKEVAVDAIRKRQIKQAEANPTTTELLERGMAADARKREAAERRKKPTAEELGIGQRLPEPAVDAHGVVEGTPAAELRDAQADRIRASKAGSVDTLERNAAVMYGTDRSKWPAKVRSDLDAARRREAAAAREEQAAANKRATEEARARVVARAAEAKAAAAAGPLPEDERGPRPVGFTPNTDKDWNLTQKRLGKRTARTSPDGELQPGDIVPTKDGKWAEVLGPDESKFWERNGLVGVKVRDDAKGYVHGESATDIKARIEKYNAEKAWRDSGGSSDRLAGQAVATVDARGLRPGEPPVGDDGKYAKPVTMYATYNGETYSRSTRNPYRYASVVATKDNPEGAVWSWHRTAEAAQKGTLTNDQRKGGVYVKAVVESQFDDPNAGTEGSAEASQARWKAENDQRNAELTARRDAERAQRVSQAQVRSDTDEYNRQIESTARMIRDEIAYDDTGDGPFTGFLDKYKERELSDRLQELVDARDAGNVALQDRIVAQIRKILLDTEVQLESDLPTVPSARLEKGSKFEHRGEVVTVTGRPYWDPRDSTWVVPTRNARGTSQTVAVPGTREAGPQMPRG